jgi:predicted transcriptional regulator
VTTKPLTPLEDAALRTIVSTMDEAGGWIDLTRICSRVGRHLADVRQAVARLARYGLIRVEETSAETERWVKIALPEPSEPA